MTDLSVQVEELQTIIQRQQDEIDQLKDLHFEPVLNIRETVKLTKMESRLLGFLMKRDLASKDAIMTALYFDRHDSEWPDVKILDILIMKTRQKLKDHDITIETVWGQGWRISSENKQKIRDLEPDRVPCAG